jgi:hypothetical protein
LELRRGRRRLTFERRGNQLLQVAGEPRLTVDQLHAATQALADFHAESALHLGNPAPEEGFEKPLLEVAATLTRPDGEERRVSYRVGAGDAWRNMSIYYVRLDGQPATYAVARSRVAPLLALLED